MPQLSRRAVLVLLGAATEDRHARFLTSIRPRLDNLAPLIVSEHGRGFWTVLDPPRDGADSRVVFVPEGPGLAALESPELAEVVAELAHYDPAYRLPPDLSGPFDSARDHLLVIFEDGSAHPGVSLHDHAPWSRTQHGTAATRQAAISRRSLLPCHSAVASHGRSARRPGLPGRSACT